MHRSPTRWRQPVQCSATFSNARTCKTLGLSAPGTMRAMHQNRRRSMPTYPLHHLPACAAIARASRRRRCTIATTADDSNMLRPLLARTFWTWSCFAAMNVSFGVNDASSMGHLRVCLRHPPCCHRLCLASHPLPALPSRLRGDIRPLAVARLSVASPIASSPTSAPLHSGAHC